MELMLSSFCYVYLHDDLFIFHCINIFISYVTEMQLCRAAVREYEMSKVLRMKCLLAFLLNLLCFLVEVHSQTEYPYVSFMGVNLPNHAYVDLTQVGNDISDPGNTVRCHTDLSTCCTGAQGIHRGDWYFPNGSVLAAGGGGGNIYRSRAAQVVHLHRRNDATSPSGIYHCDIETNSVHDNDVNIIAGKRVYVGLYPPSGGIHFFIIIFQFPKFSSSTDMSVLYYE